MSKEFLERISRLSPKRLALLALDLQSKLTAAQQQQSEPIAVIGMACRFPGDANTPDEYWELLKNGVDAITEIPAIRWDIDAYYDPDPETPNKMATRWGGFISNVDRFDPQFFGISPREAVSMDPQQRLLLETGWEALENAGYSAEQLAGSLSGVFVGICNNDYFQQLLNGDTENIAAYLATGSAFSIASGRLSYMLGLQGPSVSVDTACSSSMVSLHLAVKSLRTRECNLALACGVNLTLNPDVTVTLSRSKMMAADGRCKTFDESADGFVRSEGCGVVALKRLSDAVADGDNILAVIRGSAINQDGKSNGITAPNGPSQESVIKSALANAGVDPADISYIETHGTGTSLGDPIEVQALGAVFTGSHDADNPLILGSVKTNLGHPESAAGVAGFIKLVLMLQYGQIPPHLHLKKLSPHIAWDEYPFSIATRLTRWQPANGRLLAGISSFGFSGTNVHMVLENAPAPQPKQAEVDRAAQIFTLSAQTPTALQELAERFEAHLSQNADLPLADACFTANVGRVHHRYRLAIVANEMKQLQKGLADFGAGERNKNVLSGQLKGTRAPEAVFLFTGQGAQQVGMARQLYDTESTFRQTIDRCDQILQNLLGRSLLTVLYPEPGTESPINDIDYAQPVMFAIQYALAQLWQSWGIKPAAVMGHSAGEYVAACVAGVFSLEDGLKLACGRGNLMKNTPPGKMLSIFTNQERVAEAVAPYADKVSIATVNGPENIVISGEIEAVETIGNAFTGQGVKVSYLNISIAGHSPLMEAVMDDYERLAQEITLSPPEIEIISGMDGKPVDGSVIATPGYWRRHLREAVQFYPAITTLYEEGYRIFVEIGPAPVLTGMGQQCLPAEAQKETVWIASLRPKFKDWTQLLKSLGTLYTNGVTVDWDGFERAYRAARRRVPLPTYPFQRAGYWIKPAQQAATIQTEATLHPLLGKQLNSPVLPGTVFETQLNANWPPFLSHHRIYGVVIMPSPGYVEMALRGAMAAYGPGVYSLKDFSIHQALVLPEDGAVTVQLILSPGQASGQADFRIMSLDKERNKWKLHVTGQIQPQPATPQAVSFDAEALKAACPQETTGEAYYQKLHQLGLEFGTDFQGLSHVWQGRGEALGRMELPDALTSTANLYHIHPAFLDSCFHLLGAPLDDDIETAYLLIGIESLKIYRAPETTLWNHTQVHQQDAANQTDFTGSIRLFDTAGNLVAEVTGLHLRKAGKETLLQSVQQRPADWFYQVEWPLKPLETASDAGLLSPTAVAEQVMPAIAGINSQYNLAEYADVFAALDQLSAAYIIDALKQLGWTPQTGDAVSASALAQTLGIAGQYRRLFNRLLDILAQDGILQATADGWNVVKTPPQVNTDALLTDLQTRYPAHRAEIDLTAQCGPHLAQVLSGQQDPLDLLFPNGSLAATEAVYQTTPFARAYNALMKETIRAVISSQPADRPIRILEIGAGTGGTTAAILPELNPDRTEYTFTDVSPLFLDKAREKFAAYPFINYTLLDIETDPASQGFAGKQFDLVLAANVLHATADLRQTLSHIKQILAPGGVLALLEGTAPQRWVDLTFGLTEGWWKFADTALRSAYPLLAASQWQALLTEMGFPAPTVLPPQSEALVEQAVIVAQNAPAATDDAKGRWLILADSTGVGQSLADALTERGEQSLLVRPGNTYKQINSTHWEVNPESEEDFAQLLRTCGPVDRGAVHLWSLQSDEVEINAETLATWPQFVTGSALNLIKALANSQQASPSPLWLVTQGAQPATDSGGPLNIAQTPLWGLGRVIALEHADWWGGLVDLDTAATPAQGAQHLLAEILRPDGEEQIAWRDQQRHAARLVSAQQPPARPVHLKPDRLYLVTGGLGGLGLKIAHWLAEHGARHLVLTGRNGLPPRAQWPTVTDGRTQTQIAAVQAVGALGATVTVAAVDVSKLDAMTTLFNRFGNDLPPLAGVIHAAADLSDWPLKSMPLNALNAMLKPKINGAWNLHQLTQSIELDFMVLFSSTTALLGAGSLGHYAAANHFLDGFAHYRHSLGLPALSINWGTWDEMRVASAPEKDAVAQSGLKQMPSSMALAVLGDLLGTDLAQLTVAHAEWGTLKSAYEVRRRRPLLELLGQTPSVAPVKQSGPATNTSSLLQQLHNNRPADRHAILITFVQGEVSQVLGLDGGKSIDLEQGLFEMGLDSLMAIELKNALQTGIEQSLPSTLIFNYPTIADLAGFLGTRIETTTNAIAPDNEPVAVAEPVANAVADKPADNLDDLSEDELADLLAQKLEQLD